MLRGVGVTMALPFLESMCWGRPSSPAPTRFCGLQFPYGCGTPVSKDPKDKHYEILQKENWGFGAIGSRKDFQFSKVLEPLEPFKGDVTPLLGLEHASNIANRTTLHGASDAFFTGTGIGALNLQNSISVDQLLANHLGVTRYPSYVFGIDGGIGVAGASKTLSYDLQGAPIPAQSDPRQIFDQLFRADKQKAVLDGLVRDKSVLDKVLAESKSLANRLGKQDQRKLDEYLESVRHLEKRIERRKLWFDRPMPQVDASKLDLGTEDPLGYVKVMFDLIVLLMQTDMVRYGTFQLGSQGNNGDFGRHEMWPHKLGIMPNKDDWHSTGHNPNLFLSKWVRVLVEQYAYFLKRMSEIQEPNGSLLDNTAIVFGSANYVGHTCGNNPIVLAGGKNMKFKHGQFLDYSQSKDKPPLANLYLTILQQCGLPTRSFADSTGVMGDLLA